jgi:selenide,water dikinase
MVVTGLAERSRLVRNSTARPGGTLFLTKPLGLGVITTAIKRDRAGDDQVRAAVETMTDLNDRAAEAIVEAGVDSATDVTGFGLAGHLHTMLDASGLSAKVDATSIPLLPGALELARQGVAPDGTRRNHEYASAFVSWGELQGFEQLIIADAQTSGGLLIATREAERLEAALSERAVPAHRIGTLEAGPAGRIRIIGRIPPH